MQDSDNCNSTHAYAPINKEDSYKFIRVFEGVHFCTFVCEHDYTIATSQAIIHCRINQLSAIKGPCDTTINPVFSPIDFDAITNGRVVPLSKLEKLISSENVERNDLIELAHNMAIAMDMEPERNNITQQILVATLGADFTVSMTKRNAQNFSPYSKLRRHDLCIQHVANAFKDDAVIAGFVTTSDVTLVEADI